MSSEENKVVGDQEKSVESGAETEKEQYVKREAYEGVTKDLHKNKSKVKDLAAKVAQLTAEKNASAEERLAEEKRWEELYRKRDSEMKELQDAISEREHNYLEAVKKNALKQELGGKIKDDFLVHAELNSIQFNEDGTLDKDTLHEVANSFRESYPELIPVVNDSNPTGPSSPSNFTAEEKVKGLNELTFDEKVKLMKDPALMEEYRKKGLI